MFSAPVGVKGVARAYRWLLVVALFYAMFFSPRSTAQAPLPTISGNILTMPVVLIYDTPFRLEWQIVITGSIIDLLLRSYQELPANTDTTGAPSFFGELLNLPRLEVDGGSLWGEFALDSEQPVIFRLVAAEANNPGSSGVNGKWRISEETDATACGEGELIDIYTLNVRQEGSNLTVITNVGTFNATLQGTNMQWMGSYNEDGGVVNNTVNVAFSSSLNSLTGSSSWTYSGGGTTCSGSSQFSGVLLHN